MNSVRLLRHQISGAHLYLCFVILDTEHILIRQAREKAGFSQTEMAEELGVGRTSYIAFETGRTKLYNKLVGKMSALLGIPPEELLFGRRPDETLFYDPSAMDEWRQGIVEDYERRLTRLQEQLDSANRIIACQDAHIQTLNRSNQYLLEQVGEGSK